MPKYSKKSSASWARARARPRPRGSRSSSALVAAWEERHDPIEAPDPIEAIRAHMTDHGLGQADFARLLGARSLASDILNRRRALSLGAIRKISAAWNIPADVLIQPYKLTKARAAA